MVSPFPYFCVQAVSLLSAPGRADHCLYFKVPYSRAESCATYDVRCITNTLASSSCTRNVHGTDDAVTQRPLRVTAHWAGVKCEEARIALLTLAQWAVTPKNRRDRMISATDSTICRIQELYAEASVM